MSDRHDLGYHHLLRPRDLLYRWVHPSHIERGRVLPAHCPTAQWREGLSCDWSVLASAEETAMRKGGSLPANVLCISIRECLAIGLSLRHSPVLDETSPDYNLAHCVLFAPESSKTAIRKVRDLFIERATVVQVAPSRLRRILAPLRRFHRRRRAALRHIRDSVRDS